LRDYDIILYGATGFVGRQTVGYFAGHVQGGAVRWAIAGRDGSRLEAVKRQVGGAATSVDVLIADSRDQGAVDAMVSRTRVLLNTAGPFALYGGSIVDACARRRTHYVDITGETLWVKDLIDRYHDRASADGTRIIPFCGFDSVPSDIGTYLLVRHLRDTLGAECTVVKAYFKAHGGWNGGTIASAMNSLDSGRSVEAKDPFLLDPPAQHSAAEIQRQLDISGVRYDSDVGRWVGPYFMAPINTRVVRRSAALYQQWGAPYSRDFGYQEYLKYDPPFSKAKALGVTAALALFERALQRRALRRLLRPLLPQPGSGPSERVMERGWFRCDLLALTDDGRTVRGLVRDTGDPANRVTVKCLCESALGLIMDEAMLPGGRQRGGVLTPATGLADVLARRLRAAGMVIEIGV
jgi:short subunit dehydrogenase-like uncharacterized protein